MKLWTSITFGLLGLLAVFTAAQAFSGHYYVIPSSVPLRICASPDCASLLTAYRGDKVEILERTPQGWSKVRFVDRDGDGWLRSDLLSYSPNLRTEGGATYYVKKNSITIHDAPNPDGRVLITLHFHDPVEMLGVDASGWAKVRDLRTSLVGWTDPRNLSAKSPGSRR